MRNLRTQLLIGQLIVALLFGGVLIGAVVSFFHLGRSIDRIIRDNYDSVVAAQDMKEALERQDSAATFYLAGQVQKARDQYRKHKVNFNEAYTREANNITEPGEQEMADDIGAQFGAYQLAIDKLLFANPRMPTNQSRDYYFGTLEPAFLRLKQRAQDVLDLNQAAIVRADARAEQEARRASTTGIAVTGGALLFAFVFAPWAIRAALTPLRALARQAVEIGSGHLDQQIELQRSDEIGALAISFNEMSKHLREARRIEQQRLHRAERMSDAALESLYDPVIVTDAMGRIVHLNRAAEGLFGAEAKEAGRPVSEAIKEKSIAEAVTKAIRQERISAAEDEAGFVPIQVGGTQRTYRLRASPMRDDDGSLLGAVAVLEDITHLRELDRLKTEFIGVASHELRTPVTSLQLSVQLLQEGAVGKLTTEQLDVVKAQREDLDRLERMMRDLLDMTRLEAGVTPPRFELTTSRELITPALDAVTSQAEAKGLKLSSDILDPVPGVRADRSQIGRVLVNLLNNAIRHTPEGGCIGVRAWSENSEARFEVRDTGVGIPKEYLPRIFERFTQVPGATRGGSGLGLSIAQTIILAHHGRIWAESEPGQGSAFTFTLPLAG